MNLVFRLIRKIFLSFIYIMEINDQDNIKKETSDVVENITMKMQKTRKKYNKQEKLDKNKTKKEKKTKIHTVEERKEEEIKTERLNEKLIEMLDKMSNLMNKTGDNMRSRIYSKAADTILSETDDITNIDDLKSKPNIGPIIIAKMKEYIESGTLSILEREKNNPLLWLTDIHGIGPKKAGELIEKGIRSVDDLRKQQDELLNDKQKIGLQYYEDINKKIPRDEIDQYKALFDSEFKKVAQDDGKYEIVGSYRRGKKMSGDIDVIITSKDQGIFNRFFDLLKETKVISEVLSKGNTKSMVIGKLNENSTARRIDFMYTPPDEYPYAILYFTGSKAFNTTMRSHALKQNISLNEHGMYEKTKGKEKGKKIEKPMNSEQDIFDELGIKYQEPEKRTDGTAVKLLNNEKNVVPQVEKTEIKPKRKYTKKKKIVIQEELPELIPIIAKELPEKPSEITKIDKKIKKNVTRKKRVLKVDNKKDEEEDMNTRSKDSILKKIEEYKKGGITVLDSLKEKILNEMLTKANDVYRNMGPNEQPLMSDNQYDILEDYIKNKYPKNTIIEKIGAPVEKNKIQLPYEMASMDKIKPDTNALPTWKAKYSGPYVLSCKLDGVSGMYTTENNSKGLYTRGDGKVGQDVSHFIPYLNLPEDKDIVVRGEFIMTKKNFQDKYAKKFANSRNLIAGIVNRNNINETIKDMDFVAYEVIKPDIKPSEQMQMLEELGFKTVQNTTEENITNDMLSETLMDWRTNYDYEIDGVIVTDDTIHVRKSGNPKHSFAFKMVISDQVAEAKVVDVLYSISKSGYLKPRVRIEPIKLGGVTIEYATGFNGKFIKDNKIGIGAVIQIIRSGDVIPYIKSVVQPAEEGKMPDQNYHWNETRVDLILDNIEDNDAVTEKNITAFFTSLKVDGLSEGNVKRIMKAGFKSISEIILMKKTDFENVEGFKEKMVKKIYEGIQNKVKQATLVEIMAASNMLGRGIGLRKMKPIMETYPDILTSNIEEQEKKNMLMEVPNIGKENANSFVSNIPKFIEFLNKAKLNDKLKNKGKSKSPPSTKATKSVNKDHPLFDKHIVMTKVRDKYIIEQLEKLGAHLDDNIGKNTNVLITKTKDDVSNKIKKANDLGIPIMTPPEFVKKFDL